MAGESMEILAAWIEATIAASPPVDDAEDDGE